MQQDAGGKGVFRAETTNTTMTGASTSTSLNAADTSTNTMAPVSTSFLVSVKENQWSRSTGRKKNKTKAGEEEHQKRKADEADDDRRKVGKYRRVEGGVESQGAGGGGSDGLPHTDGDDVGKTNSTEEIGGGASSAGEAGPSNTAPPPSIPAPLRMMMRRWLHDPHVVSRTPARTARQNGLLYTSHTAFPSPRWET
jgi:hypothetical protein